MVLKQFYYYLLVAATLSVFKFASGQIIVNINQNWNVVNENKSFNVPATVPGSVYTDLMKAGILGDPYYRFNDVDYRWVAYDNWTYSTVVQVTKDVLAKGYVFLVCEGLDTAATVSINGIILNQTSDMFVRFRWSVKDLLVVGNNTIQVQFESPVYFALAQHEAHLATYGYQVPPACTAPVQHGECHVNQIRKIQASFSWDWGPAFPTMGIWKPMKLEAVNTCVVRDVAVNTENDGNTWFLNVTTYLDCSSIKSQTGNLTISLGLEPNLSNLWQLTTPVTLKPDQSTGNAVYSYSSQVPNTMDIQSWWPNGHGSQTLYNLNVTYLASGNVDSPSTKSVKIGFRTIELVQDPVSNGTGLTFYFKINGVPIFMKGSNWIPADSFPERIGEGELRNLLQSAADANMNSLRVWGGGMYEQDNFYELTDELGILIWQDMMYACAMYPTDPGFIGNVRLEITQQDFTGYNINSINDQLSGQIKWPKDNALSYIDQGTQRIALRNNVYTPEDDIRRLQHHPSILIWSGNNENEAALADNWYNTYSDYDLYKEDYVDLYVDTIMPIIQSEDTSRPYVTSSPSNGDKTVEDGYVSSNPGDPLYGDVHFYQYYQDGWDWSIYPRPRFASEYGFQSWPSFETLAKVSIEQDWDYNSDFMEHRQHHSLGNLEMVNGFTRHMKLPKGCTVSGNRLSIFNSQFSVAAANSLKMCDTVDGFQGMLYLTQVYQAISIKTETEYYRRARSELINLKGYTMGALYWQLNDIWQGASWSSIEYGGKWKVLHYYAIKFFANVLISPWVGTDGDKLSIYAINDNEAGNVDVSFKISLYKWTQFTAQYVELGTAKMVNHGAASIYDGTMSNLMRNSGCTPQECFLVFELNNRTTLSPISPQNEIFPVPFFNAVGLKKANISADVQETGTVNIFSVTLTTDHIAPLTWLAAEGIRGRFSDNGFLLYTPTKTVNFISWQNITAEELSLNLAVMSLMDLY